MSWANGLKKGASSEQGCITGTVFDCPDRRAELGVHGGFSIGICRGGDRAVHRVRCLFTARGRVNGL